MRKKSWMVIGVCILAASFATWLVGVVHVVNAQFGNVKEEVYHIADQDTGRFMQALEETTQEFPWEAGQKAAWWTLLKTKLGLDGYAANAENVELWERVRAALKTKYDATDVDTLLDGATGTLTPLAEGSGEGE